MFEVFPSTIYTDGVEVKWGDAEEVDPTTFVPNSKKMADLEWFTFGERADFYRGMGYPNNFDFRPMVLSGNADGYDALEIHFAYQGTCEDIQKSEKDITLIGAVPAEGSEDSNPITDLIAALEGLDIEVTNAPEAETTGDGN